MLRLERDWEVLRLERESVGNAKTGERERETGKC